MKFTIIFIAAMLLSCHGDIPKIRGRVIEKSKTGPYQSFTRLVIDYKGKRIPLTGTDYDQYQIGDTITFEYFEIP